MWEYLPCHSLLKINLQEERCFFPECEKKSPGWMTENVEQHDLFQPGIGRRAGLVQPVWPIRVVLQFAVTAKLPRANFTNFQPLLLTVRKRVIR